MHDTRHPDIHLPVRQSTVDERSEFHTITTTGAHDIYKINPDPGGIKFQKLLQRDPGKFEPIEDRDEVLTEASEQGTHVMREDRDGYKVVVANHINKFFANDEKVIAVFKMIGSTFRGHSTGTCGHYCLLTNLALLGEKIFENNEKVVINFGDRGLTDLELNKFNSSDTDKDTETVNRNQLKEWLKKNQTKLCDGDDVAKAKHCFGALIRDLETKETLDSYDIKVVIQQATKLTRKENSTLNPTIVNIQQAIDAAKEVNKDNAQEKLNKLKKSKELQAVFSLENITVEDVAMIALLTAFLTVVGGPGIAIAAASLLSVARTLKKFNVQVPNDDEIDKIIRPKPEIENPTAERVTEEPRTACV